jgi:DNA-binding CsgD family transcriptional regulator
MPNLEKLMDMSLTTAKERYATLTEREREVARLIADGLKNNAIADLLGIAPKTLDIHRTNIHRKLKDKNIVGVAKTVLLLRGMGVENKVPFTSEA